MVAYRFATLSFSISFLFAISADGNSVTVA